MAEELALLAIQPDGGLVRAGAILPRLSAGITVALVTELADRGHVDVDEQLHVSVVGTAPGDELLAAELEVLRRHDGERLTTSYLGIPHVGWTHVLDRHLQLGRVRREKRFLRQATYPVTEPAAHEALVAEVRAGVQGDQELDRRLTVLVALAGPSGLIDVVAPTDRERARERMATVAEQVTLASAVEPLGEARATSPIGLPGPA